MKKVRFQKAPPKPVSGRESGIDIPSGIAYRTTNKNNCGYLQVL